MSSLPDSLLSGSPVRSACFTVCTTSSLGEWLYDMECRRPTCPYQDGISCVLSLKYAMVITFSLVLHASLVSCRSFPGRIDSCSDRCCDESQGEDAFAVKPSFSGEDLQSQSKTDKRFTLLLKHLFQNKTLITKPFRLSYLLYWSLFGLLLTNSSFVELY